MCIRDSYIPDIDAGSISVQFETEQGSSHAVTEEVGNQIVKLIEENVPEVAVGGLASISGQTPDGALTAVGFKEGKNIGTISVSYTHLPGGGEDGGAVSAGALLSELRDTAR